MNCKILSRKLRLPAIVLVAFALMTGPSFAAELAAVPGKWLPPGGVAGTDEIPMWGFIDVSPDTAATYICPTDPVEWTVGPELRATSGGALTVNLKNCLPEPVSFFVPGLRATTAGGTAGKFTGEVAAGGTAAYTFNLTGRSGTFLYHSATDRIRTQVPMGLYGALVVDSAANTVYPGITYAQDEVLVFSAIDPNLNANPAGFGGARVINWYPQYFLINGKVYPETAHIALTTGSDVLLRLVNAGLKTVVPTLEGGLYLDLKGEDGNRYPHPLQQYGVELTAGKAIDAMINVTNAGSYALYDRALNLTNRAATGGGMLTYLDAAAGAGILQLSAATYSVAENVAGGILTVTVNRIGGSSGPVTVDYATADATATAGSDYTAVPVTTLNFADTQTNATFDIIILDDLTFEGNETFTVALSNATGGATLGAPSSAVVTITDNDEGPGALQFSAATYSVAENGGTLTVTVDRIGGSAGAVSVNYATANGTATAPGDYTAASGTLNFANAQASATFPITINNDATYESDETFTVSLNTPTGGATLGTPSSAVVTITNDDAAPNVAPFANDDFATATQNSPGITFSVTANDVDPDGEIDVTTVVITTGPSTQRGGTVVENNDGTVTYVPKRGFRGTDTFQYNVKDNAGATSNVATVRVNVVK
jgi:FtsP/CotA-like multicopper oxidase with cupredoxin domain